MNHGLAGALDDAIVGPGVIRVGRGDRSAEVHVVQADKLAVRVLRVRVEGGDRTVQEEATRVPDALRGLAERVVPVEVDPKLGGAVFRSAKEEVQNREFFEARSDGNVTEVERVCARPEGRVAVPFTLTREALGRMVGKLGE